MAVSWRDLANPQAGGSEVVLDRLLTGLQARGHEVALVCGGPVGARAYPVIPAGSTFSQYLRAPIACSRRFRDWDLLIDVENGVPYFSPLWWRKARICLVHHVHTDQWRLRFGPVVAAVGSFAERRVMPVLYRHDLFVAISESTASSLNRIGIARERIRVVTSGIDLPHPVSDAKAEEPSFVVLGRMVPHKRIDLVLRAWERVRPEVGGTLHLVGDGPERAHLERLAGRDVAVAGKVSDDEKALILARSWLLVHAALHEGWGLVMAEAAAVGTPTLAMDAPGVRDVVVDGVTGELVRDENELVERWIALARDPRRRSELGAAARKRAEAFSWSRSVDSFLEVAGELVA